MGGRTDDIRILVADDSAEFVAGLLSWAAGQAGLEVIGVARDGEQAVAAVASLRPDVVLMDAAMPRLNGFAATRRIRSHPGAPPVVMLTLHDSPAARNEARVAGAVEFVAKSDLAERLLPIIRSVCLGRQGQADRNRKDLAPTQGTTDCEVNR